MAGLAFGRRSDGNEDRLRYVALIPLRGGSKSIPGKNVRPIAGRPLCLWAIEAAARSARIDAVFVATDSTAIREVVEEAGLPRVQVIGRSAETATDTASTESVMLEFARSFEFDRVVLIQATSPLLQASELDAGIEHYETSGADSLLSVVRQKRFLWAPEGGLSTSLNYDPLKRPRRQDFSGYQVENGAFYVCGREGLLRTGSRLHGSIAAYEMPEETFHELDEPVDFVIIEKFLEERVRRSVPLAERAARIRLVLSDVDGVLTDSGMYYGEHGDELKKFNTRDGKAFELLRRAGLEVGIVTAEQTKLVERRASKLRLDHLIQGSTDKVASVAGLLEKLGISWNEVAFVGDDLGDVEVLGKVGLAVCPRDAVREASSRAHLQTQARGGEGVLREFAELLLELRNA